MIRFHLLIMEFAFEVCMGRALCNGFVCLFKRLPVNVCTWWLAVSDAVGTEMRRSISISVRSVRKLIQDGLSLSWHRECNGCDRNVRLAF